MDTGDHAGLDRIPAQHGDNRYSRRRRSGCQRWTAAIDDHTNLPPNQVGCERRQLLVPPFGPAVLHANVLVLDIPEFIQSLAKCSDEIRERIRGARVQKANHRQRLSKDWNRPARAKHRDERTTSHSMTSSARARSDCGTVSPSAFA